MRSPANRGGSTFTFTAKFKTIAGKDEECFVFPDKIQSLKTLVVDDNPAARNIISETLKSFAITPTLVASGAEAISELVSTHIPYQLVLMDWQMPGMSGLETSRRIRKLSELREQPKIIIVTAYGREEIIQGAQDYAVDGLLIKPITPSILFNTIIESFGRPQSGTDPNHICGPAVPAGIVPQIDLDVLLVEDNKINQQIAFELLTQAGMRVTIANNGREAVDLAFNSAFDVILMDIQMPVMDGYEATTAIRARQNQQELPIIAMTANAMSSDREKCLQIGMNGHISKPINPRTLVSTMVNWLPAAARPPGSAAPTSEISGAGGPLANGLPQNLVHLDINTALANVAGNHSLLCQLLTEFVADHSADVDLIAQALEEADLEKARRIAHTVKGMAGSFGAAKLHQTAADLEAGLKKADRKKVVASLIGPFRDAFSAVVGEIGEHVILPPAIAAEAQTVFPPPTAADRDEIESLLSEMEELLDELNPEAEEHVAQLATRLTAEAYQDLVPRLSQQVSDLEFESALATVADIRKVASL